MLSSLASATKGFNQKLFFFSVHKNLFTRPIIAMAGTGVSSSPAYSTSSPSQAPLKRVGTHNGSFHCDEALGCFMIRLTDKFFNAQIVRSRDPKVLDDLDAVLDVGGVYDPSNDCYDHHQKGFEEVFGHGFSTKLSSAGLVYKHFGKELIAKELNVDEGHPDVHRLFLAVYKNFMEVLISEYLNFVIYTIAYRFTILLLQSYGYSKKLLLFFMVQVFYLFSGSSSLFQAIDAIDNGINQYDTDKPPRYVNNTNLSSRVGKLNLDWTEPDQSAERENEAFQQGMDLAGKEFLDTVRFYVRSWLPARSIVVECIAERYDYDPSGEIMVLKRFCPWKLHLFELEEEMKIEPLIKYVLYEDDRGKQWRVQAVAVSPDRFESRKPLPAQWRGLRDDELSKEAGIPGCVFVHMSGFIGGNQSYGGALAMARAALKL
ncbi:metal-dependent protein hydrolase [Citrus sinensis]|uniref:Metal-dependent protein hydrolase n=1 Tax=Citrus sinensis TaxID=2711 RepID=A0ACB8LNU0_CITSI|nr:metal-dependent protein hydrolase [Citrus sinensis]